MLDRSCSVMAIFGHFFDFFGVTGQFAGDPSDCGNTFFSLIPDLSSMSPFIGPKFPEVWDIDGDCVSCPETNDAQVIDDSGNSVQSRFTVDSGNCADCKFSGDSGQSGDSWFTVDFVDSDDFERTGDSVISGDCGITNDSESIGDSGSTGDFRITGDCGIIDGSGSTDD